jgi:hypothetical protein
MKKDEKNIKGMTLIEFIVFIHYHPIRVKKG